LFGTICFAPGGAACCAVSRSAKRSNRASVEKAANTGIFLLFILDSSRNVKSAQPTLRSSFLAGHFFNARAEILEHHDGGVASGCTGHRTSRMGSSAGLIQPGNGHTM